MLLIDALYINNSGGLELLKYLIENIELKRIPVFYLLDNRCSKEFDYIDEGKKIVTKPSIYNRIKVYKSINYKFEKVLCFGNVPPPVKMNATVYTYFHNIFLMLIPDDYTLKHKFSNYIKRFYIHSKSSNTDYWIVQTSNTRNALLKKLKLKNENVLIIPFYQIERNIYETNTERDGYIYVSNYFKQKNHENLIKAWKILYDKGYFLTLHLTLENTQLPKELDTLIRESQKYGVKIINHGKISKNEVFNLYRKCKVSIYPSVNESLGLGIVESIEFGCDLIAPNLPYIHSICKPSNLFDPFSVDSIVSAVENYELNRSNETELIIKNEIEKLIKILN